MPLLVLLAVVSGAVALGNIPSWTILAPLMAAEALASAGASALNHYLDRDMDRAMARTRQRPVSAGRIKLSWAILFGLGFICLSVPLALALNLQVALLTLGGAFIYVVVYTWWLKRRTAWNIVVGGMAGSCTVLAGGFAVSPQITPALLILALLVFLWTPAHFWSFALVHQADYQQAGVPMLPVVASKKRASGHILLHTALVVATALTLFLVSPLGGVYLAGALVLGSLFLGVNFRLWRNPGAERAWTSYKASGAYLLLLLLVMAGDIVLG